MAKVTAYHAKKFAEKEKMQNLEKKAGKNYIFKLVKKMKHEDQGVINESCIRNDRDQRLVTTEKD